jgi:hypothetical protein
MLVTVKPTGAEMELLLSVHFLHPLHVGQAPNSTVYINITTLLKDSAEIITHNFIHIFTFITALFSIHSFYDMLILQSLCTPWNGTL